MNNLLNTLATFNEDDLQIIRIALSKEEEQMQLCLEIMIKYDKLEDAKKFLRKKEVLKELWKALLDYEKER